MDNVNAAAMAPDAPPDDELRRLLQDVKSVVVIGASTREGLDSANSFSSCF